METRAVTFKDGTTYHFVHQRPASYQGKKPTLVCLHGFPDQWYGWKTQIIAWLNAGYPVVVPHMLGYGGTDKPQSPEAYSTKNICKHIALLLDHLQLHKVILVGHDWGAAVAWRFALWHPERLLGLVTMSVPYFPPQKRYVPPDEALKRVPTFAYQAYFADPNSTKEIEANLDIFIPAIFQAPKSGNSSCTEISQDEGPNIPILREGELQALLRRDRSQFRRPPLVLTPSELEEYKRDFQRDGMHGPLSYYRTSLTRFQEEQNQNPRIPPHLPILFLYGTKDNTCPSAYVDRMKSLGLNMTVVQLEGVGHWVLLEEPSQVVDNVLQFSDGISTTSNREIRRSLLASPKL